MASLTFMFKSNTVWNFTGSSIGDENGVTASIECWGAGGHGNRDGNGGSGGAYATKAVILTPGEYNIHVGQPTPQDGEPSYVMRDGNLIVKAAGGRHDGTNSHQLVESSGSLVHIGGRGISKHTISSNADGSGGGGGAGADGDGEDGAEVRTATLTEPARGGRYNNSGVDRYGGNGAYYYAGAGVNSMQPAGEGQAPGCGGGGGFGAAPGGQGFVSVWIDSAFN